MSTAVATIEPVQQFLANVQGARDLLAGATELPDIKRIRDKASALQQFARSAELGLEAQNFAAILKIEAERKAGELLVAMDMRRGVKKSHDATNSLSELGIDKHQSSRWQRMAEVSDEQLTDLIDTCNRELKELTSAAVLRVAAHGRSIPPVELPDIEHALRRIERCVESAASSLNKKDTKRLAGFLRNLADRVERGEFSDDL